MVRRGESGDGRTEGPRALYGKRMEGMGTLVRGEGPRRSGEGREKGE